MGKSIWPKASAKRVAGSLEAHAAIALAVGALIYILAVTGTLSVMNRELQRWEQPTAPEMSEMAPAAVEKAALTVFENEDVPTTHLYVNFPQPDLPRTVITTDTQAFFSDAEGNITEPEYFPWTQFLLDLHYYLHLPHILGLTIVGALGAMLIGLSLSGFLAHPRIFRDAFTLRRGAGRLTLADLHNRMSVWTAPFHISNALTGAILGLASILAFAIASSEFEGDLHAVFDPVFGGEPEANDAPAEVASIALPLQHISENFPNLDVTYFILHDPGTAGQFTQVIAKHPTRLIFGDYYSYDPEGNYLGNVGISDGTIGQQITGSVYNVHFGNWGGMPVKLAYVAFGLALSTIIASGLGIYFTKRREKGRPAPRLEGAWEGVVWGTPTALALALLLGVSGFATETGLIASFWCALLLLVTLGAVQGKDWTSKTARLLGACLLLASLLVHAVKYSDAALSMAALPVTISLVIVALIMMTMGLTRQRTVS